MLIISVCQLLYHTDCSQVKLSSAEKVAVQQLEALSAELDVDKGEAARSRFTWMGCYLHNIFGLRHMEDPSSFVANLTVRSCYEMFISLLKYPIII
ncbi:hypothetical protein EB796_004883 [Bugula neritina]|uniref:Uncharacterized protein n=1 Tax=Bugula neritina TaxID=10212 RepID=A0A7J7KF03_BUGNE|nr:hypothetical protein EB796_004883 [Bugula neritina]